MEFESAETFRALIEQSTDVITLLDDAGTVRYQSPSVTPVLGYGETDLVGTNAFDLVHPEERERVFETFRTVVGSPGAVVEREEHRFRHADGSWIWLESTTSNRTDTEVDGYVINSRDVTERVDHRERLAEERDRYETLAEQSHDGIAIVQDGRFVYVNESCTAISGYSEAELLGMSLAEIIAPSDRELVTDRYERRLDPDSEQPPARYEVAFERADGDQRTVEVAVATITYDGAPAVLATLRDVTDQKEFEAELQRQAEELEALNRLLGHDIRNDMNVMLGWAELLDQYVHEDGTELVEKLTASAEHVVELTTVAGEFVEALTGGDSQRVEPISLRATLANQLDRHRELHPGATFVIPDGIPDVAVQANELLSSVFRNIFVNAVQHTDTDHPTIEITAETTADVARISIADDGPGVPDAQKTEIFGKGERGLDSAGTGIGLYLVQTLVDSYGGDVWVEDAEPRGAVFVLELPLAD